MRERLRVLLAGCGFAENRTCGSEVAGREGAAFPMCQQPGSLRGRGILCSSSSGEGTAMCTQPPAGPVQPVPEYGK